MNAEHTKCSAASERVRVNERDIGDTERVSAVLFGTWEMLII